MEYQEPAIELEAEVEEDLEEKYAYIFAKAARINHNEMNFILKGKQTDPSDPSKAVDKDYLSKNTKARTAERTRCPYFKANHSYIEPSCRTGDSITMFSETTIILCLPSNISRKGFLTALP